MHLPLLLLLTFVVLLLLFVYAKLRAARRTEYIRSFALPKGIFEKLQKRRPELTLKDCQLVNLGLRQFFLAYLQGGRRHIAMPSQVADDLWHEFILYTRQYERFCKKAFGSFFHHTPAVVLKTSRQNNEGLRRCWRQACKQELINPKLPTRLPLLFALDAKLGIKDGFHYLSDCRNTGQAIGDNTEGNTPYCGGDFSDLSIDGSLDGFNDSSLSFDSSSDGGSGCSGDGGCSGGCGGD